MTRRIGGGGFGDVYAARRKHRIFRSESVALKVLKPSSGERAEERFRRECEIIANLDHRNIVAVYDVLEESWGSALVQEFVPNALRLPECFREPAGNPWSARLSVALQALYGLRQAHIEHVIHRDVTPSNILVDAKGVVKLIDFGLAKRTPEPGPALTVGPLGTRRFQAPEQCKVGQPVDRRADFYGLGESLRASVDPAYSLPSSTPSESDGQSSWADGAAWVPPPPGFWDSVLNRMTALDPEGRHDSCEEVVSHFLEVAGSSGLSPSNLQFHIEEIVSWPAPPSGLDAITRTVFAPPEWDLSHLEIAGLMGPRLVFPALGFGDEGVALRPLLDRIWAVVKTEFPLSEIRHTFEQIELVNRFYESWFPVMDDEWKAYSFEYLARLGILYNRYSTFYLMRALYGGTSPGPLKEKLTEAKRRADPDGYITGI